MIVGLDDPSMHILHHSAAAKYLNGYHDKMAILVIDIVELIVIYFIGAPEMKV